MESKRKIKQTNPLVQNNANSIIQGISFNICQKTQKFIGVSFQLKDEEPLAHPENFSEIEDKQGSEIQKVIFQEGTYLKEIQAVQQADDSSIIGIRFSFFDLTNHNHVQDKWVRTREQKDGDRIFDQNKAPKGNFLNIFYLDFNNGTYLKDFQASYCFLPQLRTYEVVKSLQGQGELFINNYQELKLLENLVPKILEVTDDIFKKLYERTRDAVFEISLTKKYLQDNLIEFSDFLHKLDSTFVQISRTVGADLKKGEGRFQYDHYPSEKKKLEKLQEILEENSTNLTSLKPKVDKLRELCKVVKDLKSHIYGEILISDQCAEFQSKETYEFMQRNALNELNKEMAKIQAVIEQNNQKTALLKQELKFNDELLQEKAKHLKEIQNFQIKQQNNKLMEPQEVKEQSKKLILSYHQEYDTSIKTLNTSFEESMKKLDQKIDAEIQKMGSDSGFYKGEKPQKVYHFIMILDESGSMQGNWQSLRTTVDKFIQPFKDQGDSCPHYFSVILFDSLARIHYKRLKAKETTPLGILKGGGTSFLGGFQLALQLVQLSPIELLPVVIFMTDGNGSDITQSKQVLEQIYKTPQGQNTMFFSIGFGTGYDRKSLQDLSKSCNGGKSYVEINNQKIQSVLDALDEKDLLKIFMGISNSFEKSPQEQAIEALKRQKVGANEANLKQLDLYKSQLEQKIKALTSINKFKDEMYLKLGETTAQNQNENTLKIQEGLNKEIEGFYSKLSSLQVQIAAIDKDSESYTAGLVKLTNLIKDEETKYSSISATQSKENSENVAIRQQILSRSKLQGLQGMRKFFSSLDSIDGTIEALIQQYKNIKNLMVTYGGKLDEMIDMFAGKLQKKLQKKISDADLAQKLVAYYKLEKDMRLKSTKVILTEALKKSSDYAHYQANQKFYEQILEWINFTAVATCQKKKLPKYAKEYAKNIQPPSSKKKKKKKSKKSSDESSQSDDDSGSQSEDSDSEQTDLSEIANKEQFGDPLTKEDVKRQLKMIKKEIKTTEDKDQQKMLMSQQTYYKVLLKKDILVKTIQRCLNNIHEILSKVIGQDIVSRAFRDFDQLFLFFMSLDKKQISEFQDSVIYLQFERPEDIQQAIDYAHQKRQNQQKIEAEKEEEKNSSQQVVMIKPETKAKYGDIDLD